MSDLPPYRIYAPEKPQRTALLFHGGCFQDGDETWNAEQAQAFAQALNMVVLVLGFRQGSVGEVMEDGRAAFDLLRTKYPNLPIGVIGGSSGGFHALRLCSPYGRLSTSPAFCVAICPVIHPLERYQYLEQAKHPAVADMRAKQLKFFGSESRMALEGDSLIINPPTIPTHIIAARQDQNVPLSLLVKWIHDMDLEDNYYVLEGGHELCSKVNEVVIATIKAIL